MDIFSTKVLLGFLMGITSFVISRLIYENISPKARLEKKKLRYELKANDAAKILDVSQFAFIKTGFLSLIENIVIKKDRRNLIGLIDKFFGLIDKKSFKKAGDLLDDLFNQDFDEEVIFSIQFQLYQGIEKKSFNAIYERLEKDYPANIVLLTFKFHESIRLYKSEELVESIRILSTIIAVDSKEKEKTYKKLLIQGKYKTGIQNFIEWQEIRKIQEDSLWYMISVVLVEMEKENHIDFNMIIKDTSIITFSNNEQTKHANYLYHDAVPQSRQYLEQFEDLYFWDQNMKNSIHYFKFILDIYILRFVLPQQKVSYDKYSLIKQIYDQYIAGDTAGFKDFVVWLKGENKDDILLENYKVESSKLCKKEPLEFSISCRFLKELIYTYTLFIENSNSAHSLEENPTLTLFNLSIRLRSIFQEHYPMDYGTLQYLDILMVILVRNLSNKNIHISEDKFVSRVRPAANRLYKEKGSAKNVMIVYGLICLTYLEMNLFSKGGKEILREGVNQLKKICKEDREGFIKNIKNFITPQAQALLLSILDSDQDVY